MLLHQTSQRKSVPSKVNSELPRQSLNTQLQTIQQRRFPSPLQMEVDIPQGAFRIRGFLYIGVRG